MLAAIPFSSLDALDSERERKNQEVVRVLTGALANVVREVEFFGNVAAAHGLRLEVWKERKGTRDYTAEMARIGAEGRIEDAVVFLWAMEQVSISGSEWSVR